MRDRKKLRNYSEVTVSYRRLPVKGQLEKGSRHIVEGMRKSLSPFSEEKIRWFLYGVAAGWKQLLSKYICGVCTNMYPIPPLLKIYSGEIYSLLLNSYFTCHNFIFIKENFHNLPLFFSPASNLKNVSICLKKFQSCLASHGSFIN